LRLLFFALPVVFVILGFVASLRFLITPASHAVLRAELERRRAGGSPQDTPAETRQLIAEFSGVPFDSLPASTMSPAAGGA
jgi:oligogalacturonide transporter